MTRTRRSGGDTFERRRLFVLLGVIAVVVVAVSGYVSYNALKGLPFQSVYNVDVRLPNADRLIADDDVKVAGVRVGQVASVTARPSLAGSPPYALVRLRLDRGVRLPTDTRVEVRPASVLGATFVSLTPGRRRELLAPGATLPLSQASQAVDLTDLFQMFKGSAAKNFQSYTSDFAGGLAGRGRAFNSFFASTALLMPALEGVSQTLAAPATHLSRFITDYELAFSALAPVSRQVSELFVGGAETFGALERARQAIAATIEAAPPSEAATTLGLQLARPGLDDLARVMVNMRSGAAELSPALAVLNNALSAGVHPLSHMGPFARSMGGALAALTRVSQIPSNTGALRKLAQLGVAGEASINPLEAAQVHCNVFNLFFIELSSAFAMLGTGDGPAISNATVDNPGNSTDTQQSKAPPPDGHLNYRPVENAKQCAAGNEPYNNNTQALGNPTVPLPDSTRATHPPPGVLQRAQAVGLLARPQP